MKKILLTTTAFGLFAAGSAVASGPTVTVGGQADFQIGSSSQDSAYEIDGTVYDRDLHTRSDNEIYISVDGKTDSGLGYGAYIELEANVNQDDSTAGNNNSETAYIYLESGFGRAELGSGYDATNNLRVGADSFARATGGINGDFYKYANLNTNYLVIPGLASNGGIPGLANVFDNGAGTTSTDTKTDIATANKITYYTPRIEGVQAGVSYTPDLNERGTANGFTSDATAGVENLWSLGLNYENQFNDVAVNASAVGQWGDNKTSGFDGVESYDFGVSASYMGITAGGSYGFSDELSYTASSDVTADYWTLGAAYEFGPFAASATYFVSEVENVAAGEDAEFDNLSIGADYQLAPGLVPYVEVSFFDTDDNTSGTADNDGTVFIVGTQLNF